MQGFFFFFFHPSCYKGFDDTDPKSFYSVYGDAFATLADEDGDFDDDAPETYPAFGDSQSPSSDFMEFYAFFTAYNTPRHYAWLDKYDTRQAENRRVSRAMEKENKKVRDAARKERSELVRSLAKFMRKRDPRIAKYNKELEEKAREGRKENSRRKFHLSGMHQVDEFVELYRKSHSCQFLHLIWIESLNSSSKHDELL